MKKHYAKQYSELPPHWTIIVLDYSEVGVTAYQGFNTQTGKRTREWDSYEEAVKSIPKSPYAEPWGC